jgi:CheY-like chemotaxis protein
MTGTVRVLLIDDEAPFVRNLERLLGARGFIVRCALSGPEGLKLLEEEAPFDAVVLDVRMPGMDGLATLKEIRERDLETPVLMLTGHASLESGIEAIREGAGDYLMKPCDVEDLAEKVCEAAEAKSIRCGPVLWPRRRAAEVLCFHFREAAPGDTLRRAVEAFRRGPGAAADDLLYVVGSGRELLGTLARRDILDAAAKAKGLASLQWDELEKLPEVLDGLKVEACMRGNPPHAEPGDRLRKVASRMIALSLQTMAVVRDGRMEGIIRIQDVLLHAGHSD